MLYRGPIAPGPATSGGGNTSLEFNGLLGGANENGTTLVATLGGDVTLGADNITDRVRVELTSLTQAANIGNGDFTIEIWLRPRSSTYNQGPATTTGSGTAGGTSGNVFFDRDYLPSTSGIGFGLSLAGGRVTWWGGGRTVTGTTDIRDDQWHFVQVLRDATNGTITIRVDGTQEASDNQGSTYQGDWRYDPASPGTTGPATYSNPYMVFGAEKHDYDPGSTSSDNPSYHGYIADIRISNNLRSNSVPTSELTIDSNTVWASDIPNSSGTTLNDRSGNSANGVLELSSESFPKFSSLTPY